MITILLSSKKPRRYKGVLLSLNDIELGNYMFLEQKLAAFADFLEIAYANLAMGIETTIQGNFSPEWVEVFPYKCDASFICVKK